MIFKKVGAIQKELEELEERANHLNRERQKDISGITYINDRIKAELRKKDAIAEREWKGFKKFCDKFFSRQIFLRQIFFATNFFCDNFFTTKIFATKIFFLIYFKS